MHDPFGFLAVRSTTSVEDKSLTKSNLLGAVEMYGFVSTSSFPEPGCSGPVRSGPSRIFLVLVTKEVPLVLRTRPDSAFLYIQKNKTYYLYNVKKRKYKLVITIVTNQNLLSLFNIHIYGFGNGLLYVCNVKNHWLILRV